MGVPEAAARSILYGHTQVALSQRPARRQPRSRTPVSIAMDYGRRASSRRTGRRSSATTSSSKNLARMLHLDNIEALTAPRSEGNGYGSARGQDRAHHRSRAGHRAGRGRSASPARVTVWCSPTATPRRRSACRRRAGRERACGHDGHLGRGCGRRRLRRDRGGGRGRPGRGDRQRRESSCSGRTRLPRTWTSTSGGGRSTSTWRGTFLTVKHAVRSMPARGGGSIILTGSPTGVNGEDKDYRLQRVQGRHPRTCPDSGRGVRAAGHPGEHGAAGRTPRRRWCRPSTRPESRAASSAASRSAAPARRTTSRASWCTSPVTTGHSRPEPCSRSTAAADVPLEHRGARCPAVVARPPWQTRAPTALTTQFDGPNVRTTKKAYKQGK